MSNENELPLRVMIRAKEDPNDAPYTLVWDIRSQVRSLLLGFGNGVWREIRVIGESQAALNLFRRILQIGGYAISNQPMAKATLFQAGDECWAGFVFLDPQPQSLPE